MILAISRRPCEGVKSNFIHSLKFNYGMRVILRSNRRVIINSRLGPIAQSKATEKISDVIFDGFFRNIKVLCDFSIAGAGCD